MSLRETLSLLQVYILCKNSKPTCKAGESAWMQHLYWSVLVRSHFFAKEREVDEGSRGKQKIKSWQLIKNRTAACMTSTGAFKGIFYVACHFFGTFWKVDASFLLLHAITDIAVCFLCSTGSERNLRECKNIFPLLVNPFSSTISSSSCPLFFFNTIPSVND